MTTRCTDHTNKSFTEGCSGLWESQCERFFVAKVINDTVVTSCGTRINLCQCLCGYFPGRKSIQINLQASLSHILVHSYLPLVAILVLWGAICGGHPREDLPYNQANRESLTLPTMLSQNTSWDFLINRAENIRVSGIIKTIWLLAAALKDKVSVSFDVLSAPPRVSTILWLGDCGEADSTKDQTPDLRYSEHSPSLLRVDAE